MHTKLLYLDDAKRVEVVGTIVRLGEGERGKYAGENGVELGYSIEQINQALKQAIMTCALIVTRSVTYDELREICPRIPHGLPTNKPLRVVQIGDHVLVPLCLAEELS